MDAPRTNLVMVESPDQFFQIGELGSDTNTGSYHQYATVLANRSSGAMRSADPGELKASTWNFLNPIVVDEIEGVDVVCSFLEFAGQAVLRLDEKV